MNSERIDKYGFYNVDNAFLTADGHCWSNAVDLLQCHREDTGDTIELKSNYINGEVLSCEASIYRIFLNETDYKYSGLNENDELYIAIGETKNGLILVSHDNKSWDEALKRISRGGDHK